MRDLIVLAHDGSANADAAVGFVELIPSHRVVLVHAWHRDMESDFTWPNPVTTALAAVQERLERHGRVVTHRFGQDDPAHLILDTAEDADIIVMATRGAGAVDRARYGSVADRVARHAKTPVLLARSNPETRMEPRVSRIFVPLDGSAFAESAIPHAIGLADDLGVPLHFARVVDIGALAPTLRAGVQSAMEYTYAIEAANEVADEYLAQQAKLVTARELVATTELREGSPVTELLEIIQPSDLVVMSSHGHGGIRRWLLGSVAEKVVRFGPAPVMIVRPGERAPV